MYELECTIWVLFSWALKGRTQEWVHWPPLRPQTKTGWVPEGHAATILWVKFCRMPIVWPLTPPPPYLCVPPSRAVSRPTSPPGLRGDDEVVPGGSGGDLEPDLQPPSGVHPALQSKSPYISRPPHFPLLRMYQSREVCRSMLGENM